MQTRKTVITLTLSSRAQLLPALMESGGVGAPAGTSADGGGDISSADEAGQPESAQRRNRGRGRGALCCQVPGCLATLDPAVLRPYNIRYRCEGATAAKCTRSLTLPRVTLSFFAFYYHTPKAPAAQYGR